METLKNLIELKNFVEKNPTFSSAKWHKLLGVRYSDCIVLKKNKIILNKGSKLRPQWVWNAPIPNSAMADELQKRVLSFTRAIKKKNPNKTQPKQTETKSFLRVLEGFDIRINEYISARVTDNSAVIKRDGFSMEIKDPEIFSNIIKLVK